MSLLTKIERTYTSKAGSAWCLYYDPKIGRACITGNDIGFDTYPVYDGRAKGLVLEQDELKWLANAWIELASEHNELSMYLGKNTQFIRTEKFCQLSEDFCPICLTQKQQFHTHHCIESRDGGSNDSRNLLRICQSCHVVLTSGSFEDRLSRGRAAWWHQIAHFGIGFLPSADSRGGRHPDVSFHTLYPQFRQVLEHYKKCSAEEQQEENRRLMEFGRVEYQYFRDLGLGKRSWSEFERLFCESAEVR